MEGNPTIHHRHKEKLILNYCSNNKKCCDPYKKHKKAVRFSLKAVTLGLEKRTNGLHIHLIQGQKICPGCHAAIFKDLEVIAYETSISDTFDDFEQECDESQSKIAVNDSLLGMEIHPVKAHSLVPYSRVSHVKIKMKQIDEHLMIESLQLRKFSTFVGMRSKELYQNIFLGKKWTLYEVKI